MPDRWWRWQRLNEISCPEGHRIPQTFGLGEGSDGCIRCNKWIVDGASQGHECGRRMWLGSIRGGGLVVVEVSSEEKESMQTMEAPAAKLEYLGVFRRNLS